MAQAKLGLVWLRPPPPLHCADQQLSKWKYSTNLTESEEKRVNSHFIFSFTAESLVLAFNTIGSIQPPPSRVSRKARVRGVRLVVDPVVLGPREEVGFASPLSGCVHPNTGRQSPAFRYLLRTCTVSLFRMQITTNKHSVITSRPLSDSFPTVTSVVFPILRALEEVKEVVDRVLQRRLDTGGQVGPGRDWLG